MPIPVVGRAGPGRARKRAAAAKSLQIVSASPLQVGTQTVTFKATGIPRIGWSVFQNVAPNYPWYTDRGGDNIAVPANGELQVSVTLSAVGDRIKLFESTGAASRDFTFMAESAGAVAAPGAPAPTVPGSGNAAAVLAKMGLGVNQERFTVLPDKHPEARSSSYYARYKAMGINWVRLYRPVGFEGWQVHPNSANASSLTEWLDAAEAALAGGMNVVQIDGTDVVGDWEINGQPDRISALDGWIQRFGAAIAARPNLPAAKVIVGACQEYGAGTNVFWEPHRLRWNGYLRAALPNHTIVEGPCNWKDPRALFDASFNNAGVFNKWSDANSLVDVHHYIGWETGAGVGMDWLFTQVKNWSAANNRGVICGEYGFDDPTYGDYWNIDRWIERMDAMTQHESICLARPNLWATTDGNAWPINEKGGNSMRPNMEAAIKRWAGRVDARIAAAAPAATPATPAQPSGGGSSSTLNVLVRGQSNAYFFCDWGNGYPEGVRLMRERLASLTGRTVNTIYAFGNAGNNTIYSGTEFLTEWMNGTSAGNLENAILNYVGALPAAQRTAPFVEIWMHNESDQKNNPSKATWVAAVRAEAALMRAKLGLTASQHLRYFVKVRYPYGNPSGIFDGMAELAADASFNARVSEAAMSAAMNGGPEAGNNSSHIGPADASLIATNLANELAALYPRA